MDKISAGIDPLVPALSPDGGADAAEAIMTTDTRAKQAVVRHDGWSVGGMAKGAAMLAPGLATMLVLITTDAVVEPGALAGSAGRGVPAQLRTGGQRRLHVHQRHRDRDEQRSRPGSHPEPADLQAALTEVCLDLAQQLIDDAEGAAHSITISVTGAATEADAVEVGKSVARNNLFKCAVFGRDPNWGRVLAAIGTTSAAFEPDELDVAFNGVQVCRAGGIGDAA